MMKTLSDGLENLGKTLKGIVKITALSRHASIRPQHRERPLIILGNGPSLRDTINNDLDKLKAHDTMAVNFAAAAPEFFDIRPRYYIIVDPFFFSDEEHDKLSAMYKAMAAVDWHMTLIIPVGREDRLPKDVRYNAYIDIVTINAIGVEGFMLFRSFAYGKRLAMPRPRNVLIPAIMSGIWLGYKDIYIVGADHSWMSTISVDDHNRVISVQPHFYKDSANEQTRVNTEYQGYKLHDIIHSFYTAFKSYHDIRDYATRRHIAITNSTPGSFIDAFPRAALPSK